MNTVERLVEYGIKPSVQRIAIMEYLMTHRTHPTADEVYMALCDSMPTLSKTTVYNTLKLFVDQQAALMLTINDKNVHFDGDTSLHSHFFCRKCGRVFDLPFSGKKREARELQIEGHAVEEIHHYYKGICKECSEKESLV
ncbi:MAG: transcriptional repressor [Bacteroidaceae bacterium]|nr:transcriptional repressor [Bacteroidaceae bacterium]